MNEGEMKTIQGRKARKEAARRYIVTCETRARREAVGSGKGGARGAIRSG